jgi:hypothetical protein
MSKTEGSKGSGFQKKAKKAKVAGKEERKERTCKSYCSFKLQLTVSFVLRRGQAQQAKGGRKRVRRERGREGGRDKGSMEAVGVHGLRFVSANLVFSSASRDATHRR